ncbi:MAG: SCO family protein [Chloroflexi bacterium]|nr:SCO family protein [Chloroflexota bacterium]
MSRQPGVRITLFAIGLGVWLLAMAGVRVLSWGEARSLEVYGEAPAFALTDHLERPVRSDEFRGKVVVANFVYTNCADVCPLLSFRMQALQERLRQERLLGSQVQLLSFTVDPARDTPPVLRDYAARYQADPAVWRFLTGPEDELVPLIVQGFHLGVEALPPREATPGGHEAGGAAHQPAEVMHSNRFLLIDRQWRVRAYYDGRALDAEQVVGDIRQLLR